MNKYWVVIGIAWLSMSAQVCAENRNSEQWLQFMMDQNRALNYHGVFLYQYGDEAVSAKIYHGNLDGKEYSKLIYLDGKKGEVVKEGNVLSYLEKKNKKKKSQVIAPDWIPFSANLSDIKKSYRLDLKGSARIAQRDAAVIGMIPNDPFRYEQTLYIDKLSGVLLKSEMVCRERKTLERFQFVSVSIGDDLPKEVRNIKSNIVEKTLVNTLKADRKALSWRLSWVPRGYKLISFRNDNEEESYLLSDGMSSFSVYLESIKANRTDREGVINKGPSIVFSKRISLKNEWYYAVIVGEIPLYTAKRIAQAIVKDE
jgi:sigma-E factor negative regulatory protein RseB